MQQKLGEIYGGGAHCAYIDKSVYSNNHYYLLWKGLKLFKNYSPKNKRGQ